MVTLAEALAGGTRHHQAGRLAEAERCYRQVLQADPQNPQALHLLGALALEAGRYEAAVELIEQAIRRDRSQAAFHANLGEAYRRLDQSAEAIACYRQAVKLKPDLAHAHAMLGTLLHGEGKLEQAAVSLRKSLQLKPENHRARARLAHVLQDQNELADAEACFRRVLRSEPNAPQAHFDLGSVLQAQGKLDEAARCYRTALELQPNDASAHINLGAILQARQAYDEAESHFRAAVQAQPEDSSAQLNLGTNYQARDQLAQAETCYRAALRLDSRCVAAHSALGSVLLRQGKSDEALTAFEEAIRLEPREAESHLNASAALQAQGKFNAALTRLEEAIRLDPNNALAYSNLGVIRNEQGRRDDAVAACRRAIELDPKAAEAHNNLAVALMALGRMDEAIASARQAAGLSPVGSPHGSNLLYMLNYDPRYDPATIFAEHRAWAARHADPVTARSAPHSNDPAPDRRLRVGYVSAHFIAHAVNFFTEPILAAHDHEHVEVFCYAHVDQPDEITARLRACADHWRDIAHLSDEQVSQLVRDDRIDILVDLAGHIGGNRLGLFARKPAPVQVTYIGYQNTTGMRAMDYRLTDAWADPPGVTDEIYTEKLVRLPRSFFCYLPSPDAPPVSPLPALEKGHITFGSFNAFAKIGPTVLATWARLLDAVPGSRLVIVGNAAPSLVEYLTHSFEKHGVETGRLTLADRRPREGYLELIRQVDVALDPFPFNGHTTTCDALWQGVPVVTLAGETYVSRFGASAHVNMELESLIAKTPDESVEIAARVAGDVERLAELRASLRQRMAASPLLDSAGFTRELEAAYRKMWIDWCNARPT